MKIFVDEDTGKGVAQAMSALGMAYVDYVGTGRRIKKATIDEDWIPYVGRRGFLLLSCNTGILESDAQRELLIRENVGAIFFSGQATKIELMRLILNRWEWIRTLDETEPRPFAYILPLRGKARRIPLT